MPATYFQTRRFTFFHNFTSDLISQCGSVTFASGETSKTVTFSTAEVDTNYLPFVSPGTGTGTPNMMLAWWRTKTTGGFVIDISGDPGAGNTVIVDYIGVRCT